MMQNKHLIVVCNRNFHLQVRNTEVSVIDIQYTYGIGMVMQAVQRDEVTFSGLSIGLR